MTRPKGDRKDSICGKSNLKWPAPLPALILMTSSPIAQYKMAGRRSGLRQTMPESST